MGYRAEIVMMPGRPLVSILTPAFNQSSYMEYTIRSVLNQTYPNWEWIIVDDGSTDGTADIITGIKDSRIKYIFQEHAGIDRLTQTRNKALALCNGDFVAMLDGDDYWPEYKLKEQCKNFSSPDIVLSYGDCVIVNRDCREIHYGAIPADRHIANNDPVGSALRLFLLKRSCFIMNSTVMLDRRALLNIGGFVEAKGLPHDFTTWTRLSLEGRFAGNSLCLGYRRRHPSSTNDKRSPEGLMNCGLDFLRQFVVMNKQRLADLGFFYDTDVLDAHWRKLHPCERYYNRAVIALANGSFREAREAFTNYLKGDTSLKARLIYFLIIFSYFLQYDLVNPISDFKVKAEKSMRKRLETLIGGKKDN